VNLILDWLRINESIVVSGSESPKFKYQSQLLDKNCVEILKRNIVFNQLQKSELKTDDCALEKFNNKGHFSNDSLETLSHETEYILHVILLGSQEC